MLCTATCADPPPPSPPYRSKKKIAEKYGQEPEHEDEGGGGEEGGAGGRGDGDADADAEAEEAVAAAVVPIMRGGERFTDDSMQTLRERLQARISSLQAARASKKRPFQPSAEPRAAKAAKKSATQGLHSANRVKGTDPNAGLQQAAQGSAFGAAAPAAEEAGGGGGGGTAEALEMGGEVDIDFSTFSGEGGVGRLASNKGKPGTKKQRLERMLESADNRRARLEQLRNSGESGRERLKEEQWNDVLGHAQGRDVVDAVKVKKALKRREKDKQKSAREWGARTKAVEAGERAKIDKREGNLKARKNGAKQVATEEDVKAAAKGHTGGRNKEKALNASRERRPGFEGKAGGAKGHGQFLNSKEKRKQAKPSASE